MFPTTARPKERHRHSHSHSHHQPYAYGLTYGSAAAYQRESSPPPAGAADSCYGVQSLSSDWGSEAGVDLASSLSHAAGVDQAAIDESRSDDDSDEAEGRNEEYDDDAGNDGQHSAVGLGITPTPAAPASATWLAGLEAARLEGEGGDSDNMTSSLELEDDHGVRATANSYTRVIPPSPEDSVHPLDTLDIEETSASPQEHSHDHVPRSLSDLNLIDSPYIPTSEPSSPASFTSMPSYVASLSSLSRTSSVSPLENENYSYPYHYHTGDRSFHHPIPTGSGHGAGVGDDLVLPTLSLPSESLSLHMSLRKWAMHDQANDQEGLKAVLIGQREIKEKTLKALREKCELVELARGVVGIIEDDTVVMRIFTGLTLQQTHERISQVYHTLNRLLHPDPPQTAEAKAELQKLVKDYAARSDWVHQVIVLDDGSADAAPLSDAAGTLDNIAPTIKVNQLAEAKSSHDNGLSSPQEHSADIEPTPRPSEEAAGEGYFAPRWTTRSPSSSRDSSPVRQDPAAALAEEVAAILHSYTRKQRNISHESVGAFLNWRQSHTVSDKIERSEAKSKIEGATMTMTSSITSNSAASSSSYGVGYRGVPMPTVARAQGGGEWEATLSRRIAQRKETDSDSISAPTSTSLSAGAGAGAAESKGSSTLYPPRGSRGRPSTSTRGRRRRSIEKERERERKCAPLFPLLPTHSQAQAQGQSRDIPRSLGKSRTTAVGLGNLVEKTFGTFKWGTRGWRGVVLACAVAVAVGWGCWVTQR